jgi:hypothetical protein
MQQATVLGFNPSQVSVKTDVQDAIFPDEDYTGDDNDGIDKEKPPVVWVDATPVREIPADRTSAQTAMIAQYSIGAPTQIIPRSGNNQRARVLVRNLSDAESVWLLTGDSQPSTPIVTEPVAGIFIVSNAFELAALADYEHKSAAPLWAVNINAVTTTLVPITMITDSYTPSDKR